MHLLSRRRALGALGRVGIYAGLGAPLPSAAWSAPAASPATIDSLAATLRPASRSRALELAAEAVRGGTPREALLGAVLKIGVEDVRPRPHGILHTAMMVHSSFVLGDGASPEESWLAALWNLDDLKTAQERDRREDGDWVMPDRPAIPKSTPGKLRADFAAAMDAWDPQGADRAVVGLLAELERESVLAAIRPYAVRCRAFIGHKAIYGAQLERALERNPWSHAEPAIRSLVQALLVDRDTGAWDRNVERMAAGAGKTAAPAPPDPARALELYRRLRGADEEQAVSLLLEALEEGWAEDDAWTALAMAGTEIFFQRKGRRSRAGREALLPVHGLTVVNALGWMARTAGDARLSRLCLLQAAAWLPPLREWLVRSVGLATSSASLESLAGSRIAGGLESGMPAAVFVSLSAGETGPEAYWNRLRTSLLRTAREHHQHKYAVAMLEESRRAPASLRPFLMAPAADYLMNPADAASEVHGRSLAALRRAGLMPG